ncbi:hypothetical protein YC2023_096586 [Brassica napus]
MTVINLVSEKQESAQQDREGANTICLQKTLPKQNGLQFVINVSRSGVPTGPLGLNPSGAIPFGDFG